ncbi:MAG: prolipoprotein diacylglyceryl transferase [Thermodesulfobacteriota bacterium]
MQFTWNVDPVLIHLGGGLGLRYYGLIFSLVFLGGFFLFRWQVLRAGGGEDDAYGVILPGALGAVIGARLGHCLFYELEHTLADPLWVLKIWQGGLASHGAVLGLFLALWWYARQRRQSLLECLDRFMFSTALGATLVRIGNFFNSEIVGLKTGGSWGVRFPRWDGLPAELAPLRHPSQLYEAALGLISLGVLFWADRRFGREERPRGLLFGLGLTVYFTGRFLVEFVKEHQVLPSDFPLDMGHLLSIPAAAAGVAVLVWSWKRRVPAGWNPTGAPDVPTSRAAKPRPEKGRPGKSRGRRKNK